MNLLVTAGPTREWIDPVRFISNRSSGKMGFAVARAARARGHAVTLISGPVTLPDPEGVRVARVDTAEDMLRAVREWLPACDALVMAAAVADWRPKARSALKLKKAQMQPVLELERTPDILGEIRRERGARVRVGFAAETGDPLPEARRKLSAKGLDLIVANDVTEPGAGFEVDTNAVTLLGLDGAVEKLPLMSKDAVAERIILWLEGRLRLPSSP